jgi:hypothetical protein
MSGSVLVAIVDVLVAAVGAGPLGGRGIRETAQQRILPGLATVPAAALLAVVLRLMRPADSVFRP